MRIVTDDEVRAALGFPGFVDRLGDVFRGEFSMPPRQVLPLSEGAGNEAFALLPAWNDEVIALKAFTYFPENLEPKRSLYSKILVFDRKTGEPLALVDGTEVTNYRTAAVSALASRYLSRDDSTELLVVGTGNLVPYLVEAHVSVRPIQRVRIWGRNGDKAKALAAGLSGQFGGVEVGSVGDLEAGCGVADVIVAATASPQALVHGAWVKAGTHTDFLGNHHADKRECDSEMVTKARVFVDNRANCFKEAGELLEPVKEGLFSLDQVEGELADLCRGTVIGRQSSEEVTMFKSVGCALGDMAGAMAAIEG